MGPESLGRAVKRSAVAAVMVMVTGLVSGQNLSDQLLGTYEGAGTSSGATAACKDLLYLGPSEVLIKTICQPPRLIRGHWYTAGPGAILEGNPQQPDIKVPLTLIDGATILYNNNTKLTRTNAVTPIDTLKLVGHGYWVAKEKGTNVTKLLFTEGMFTEFEADGNVIHAPWVVDQWEANSVVGRFIGLVPPPHLGTTQEPSLTFRKLSPTTLLYKNIEFVPAGNTPPHRVI